jgi:hypothetical protein
MGNIWLAKERTVGDGDVVNALHVAQSNLHDLAKRDRNPDQPGTPGTPGLISSPFETSEVLPDRGLFLCLRPSLMFPIRECRHQPRVDLTQQRLVRLSISIVFKHGKLGGWSLGELLSTDHSLRINTPRMAAWGAALVCGFRLGTGIVVPAVWLISNASGKAACCQIVKCKAVGKWSAQGLFE